jgi:hypothetical protein
MTSEPGGAEEPDARGEKPRLETRLTSLQRALEKMSDTREVDLSTTYKKRIREKLIAKHRR